MTLKERFDRLDDRERRLLGILVVVFAGFLLMLLPLALTAVLGSRERDNDALRDAISSIDADRDVVQKAAAERRMLDQRYAQSAPQLAGFLADLAKQSSIEIPETQDRDAVPHGKRYEERSTKLLLRKVGMLNLTRFMERIEQSNYPLSINRLNVRKRGVEPDSYDVEMVVSAFDRKAKPAKAESAGGKPAATEETP